MTSRLLVAALLARGVVERARTEFDALVPEGDDDMPADEVVRAAVAHRAEALLFANTLALSAEHAYVLQTGRTVLDGPASALARDATVRRIYPGLEGTGPDVTGAS